MGSSTTGQSSGSGGRTLGEARLLLGLIFRFVDGFRASSWEAAADTAVAEDLERFEKLDLPARARTAVEADAIQLLRRRHELVREQARLSKVGIRLICAVGVVTFVGAPILNMLVFGVGVGRFLLVFFDYLVLLVVAWLLISLQQPLLRFARAARQLVVAGIAFAVTDSAGLAKRLQDYGSVPIAGLARTPWGDVNVRLEAPDGTQLTLFGSETG